MRKITGFLSDKRYIAAWWVLAMLFVRNVMKNILNLGFLSDGRIWNLLCVLTAAYTILILVWDIVHHQLEFRNPAQMILWIFWIETAISTALGRGGHNLYRAWIYEFLLIMKIYIFFVLVRQEGKKKTDHLFYGLAKTTILVFTIINLVSLFIYIRHQAGYPDLPGEFAYETMYLVAPRRNVMQYYGLYEWMTDGGYRLTLSFLLACWLYERKQIHLPLLLITCISCVIMVLLGRARTTEICFGLVVLYLLYKLFSHLIGRGKAAILVSAVLVAGIVAVCVLKRGDLASLAEMRKTDPEGFFNYLNDKSSDRMRMWRIAISQIDGRWLLGNGWAFMSPEISAIGSSDMHNIFLTILVSAGMFGLIPFVVFLIYGGVRILLHQKLIHETKSGWMVIVLVCVLFQSCLDPGILAEASHIESLWFWLFFGYLIYLPEVSRKRVKTE